MNLIEIVYLIWSRLICAIRYERYACIYNIYTYNINISFILGIQMGDVIIAVNGVRVQWLYFVLYCLYAFLLYSFLLYCIVLSAERSICVLLLMALIA